MQKMTVLFECDVCGLESPPRHYRPEYHGPPQKPEGWLELPGTEAYLGARNQHVCGACVAAQRVRGATNASA